MCKEVGENVQSRKAAEKNYSEKKRKKVPSKESLSAVLLGKVTVSQWNIKGYTTLKDQNKGDPFAHPLPTLSVYLGSENIYSSHR